MNTLPPPTPPSAPATTGRPKPPAKTIGIFAAVAVVAAGGTFLVTRGDDAKTVAPATTTTVAVTVPPSTTAPVVVDPSTTVETVPDTVPETVPDTVVIPDGATDLGYGVYVPAIDGVEVTGDGPFTLSAGIDYQQVVAQVLNRDYSEDPNDLMQEYIDTWDADYDNVVYTLSTVYEPGYSDHPNLRYAQVGYSIHRPIVDVNIVGIVAAVVRDDGLSLVLDHWGGSPGQEGLLSPVYAELIDSLAAAPAVGEPHEFAPASTRVLENSRPTIDIPFVCMCQVVAAPGYSVTASTATSVTLTDTNTQLILQRIEGMTSVDVAQQTAAQMVQGLAPSATVSNFDLTDRPLPNYFASWNVTSEVTAQGGIWFIYDEDAQAMLIAISSTVGRVQDSNSLPFMIAGFAWQQWTIN